LGVDSSFFFLAAASAAFLSARLVSEYTLKLFVVDVRVREDRKEINGSERRPGKMCAEMRDTEISHKK